MGKFSGVLIASDFDNTMVYTEGSLKGEAPMPVLSEENRRAIEYFISQGGTFSVATGRAMPAFDAVRGDIPMNGPTILFNGAAIYDYEKRTYLHAAYLPRSARAHVEQILRDFPDAGCEFFHDDTTVHALQCNAFTLRHSQLTHAPYQEVAGMEQIPEPITKALLEIDAPRMGTLVDYVRTQPWSRDFEIITSSNYLLELTARGANKGTMVQKLQELLGIAPENTYCVGDHANDIPMLRVSHIPFAPQNAIEAVLALENLHVLPHCRENAIAHMIGHLDTLY